jgi:stage II sporulation protein D
VEDEVVTMTMEDYLWRVLAAEMPASFASEALKAQAAAARTAVYQRMLSPSPNHPDADVCTDYHCCQAYITPEEAAANWGTAAAAYAQKLQDAVSATDGMAVLYEGQPIQAVYHSSSAGRTQNAEAVWGSAVPYLVSVDTPEGNEVPNYTTTVSLPLDQFRETFLSACPTADLSGSPEGWFGPLSEDGSSRTVGGVSVQNTLLRTLFSLRSASFTASADEDAVTFTVTGYGHGVGLSQYGANALAKEGKTWEEILLWYYTGTEIALYAPI